MERNQFIEILAAEGYGETVTVEREANGFLDVHTHPFEAKALIVDGEISIRTDRSEQRYQTGHIFHLTANEPHAERYGPAGVKYVVGRK
jgi:quercetin dioxygenase-like cupin family protein